MLRVGILGAGGMGNVHARQYSKMQDVEMFFFDSDDAKGNTYEERWHAARCSSFEDLISKTEAIDICLPNNLHHEYAVKAIQAGKPVFLEKPITNDLESARDMLRVLDEHNAKVMVGQVVRYFPEFKRGNALVKAGKVGTPAAARTRRGGSMPASPWFHDHHVSGGVLVDLAVHDFDWLRWTLGEVDHLYAKSVGAATMQGPDYALTTLTFESGAVAHVESTWMDPSGSRTTFEVCGSGGMIEFDSRTAASLKAHTGGTTRFEGPLAPTDDPYYGELRDFVDCIVNDSAPPVTAYDGFMALSIALAAVESAKTGKVAKPARS